MNNWLDTLVSKETGQFHCKERSSLWSEVKGILTYLLLWLQLGVALGCMFSQISAGHSLAFMFLCRILLNTVMWQTPFLSRLGHIHARNCIRLYGQATLQLSSFALWCSHSDKILCLWLKQESVRFVNILVRITWVPSAQLLMPFGTALDVGSQWQVSCAVWLLFSSQTHTSIFWAPSTLLQIAPYKTLGFCYFHLRIWKHEGASSWFMLRTSALSFQHPISSSSIMPCLLNRCFWPKQPNVPVAKS